MLRILVLILLASAPLVRPASTTAQPAAPPDQTLTPDLRDLSGVWVPTPEHPKDCAPSATWIASTDQAIQIEPRSIQEYRRRCSVEFVSILASNSLRVRARCVFGGHTEDAIMTLALVAEQLTLVEKGIRKTYARCQR